MKKFENSTEAVQLIVAQQIVQLATVQAGAIKDLKMDKVVVMGGGANGSATGPGTFVNELFKNVLPLHEVARAAGLNLPSFLGSQSNGEPRLPDAKN